MREHLSCSKITLFSMLLVALSACSGGSTNDLSDGEVLANDDSTASPATLNPDGSTFEETSGEPEPPVEPPVELTPVDLGAPSLSGSLNISSTRFIEALEGVVLESLVEMNTRLQSGEDLDQTQSLCLGTYDPAIGEALLAIDCDTEQLPISVPDFSMLLTSGTVAATSNCNEDILALNAASSNCRLVNAELLLPVEWQISEGSLPTPFWSGFAEYNVEPNQMRIFSLENSVTEFYDCTVNLSNATVVSDVSFGNCNAHFDRFTDRLQAWLDRR